MKVRALKVGYYNHRRVGIGEVFDMEDQHYMPMDESGKPLVYSAGTPKAGQVQRCSWVEPVDGPAKPVQQDKIGNKRRKADLNDEVI